ncbi:hypothetical protein [Volucribacter psittacicida]|nr:hypothetical protein [Volucribacter psittacicida]
MATLEKKTLTKEQEQTLMLVLAKQVSDWRKWRQSGKNSQSVINGVRR